jgi:lipopolysaccharide biosynthesis glycosyltransferase
MTSIPIVLCADNNILYGLHVTLFSMLRSSSAHLKIYLLHKNISNPELALIEKTCVASNGSFEIVAIRISDERFKNLRPLVGNTFAYAKLVIPEFVPESRAIYCDSDLLFMLDVSRLFSQNLDGHSIGASGTQNLVVALESEFFLRLGIDKRTRVLNSGVLLLDLDKWRSEQTTRICLEFGSQHAKYLFAADQTILNAVFRGKFAELEPRYNHVLYPYSAAERTYGDRIYHFVGAPKPWDPFGNVFHKHYALYADYLACTALPPISLSANMNWRAVRRAARLSRRYMSIALGNFRQSFSRMYGGWHEAERHSMN